MAKMAHQDLSYPSSSGQKSVSAPTFVLSLSEHSRSYGTTAVLHTPDTVSLPDYIAFAPRPSGMAACFRSERQERCYQMQMQDADHPRTLSARPCFARAPRSPCVRPGELTRACLEQGFSATTLSGQERNRVAIRTRERGDDSTCTQGWRLPGERASSESPLSSATPEYGSTPARSATVRSGCARLPTAMHMSPPLVEVIIAPGSPRPRTTMPEEDSARLGRRDTRGAPLCIHKSACENQNRSGISSPALYPTHPFATPP
ncbi:hypothetical protein C8Q77DRAFT_820373 [Trametes polyzona]|nr:hypothetical protein C8Q77DRAFT_820373 [Trametes polyzona]